MSSAALKLSFILLTLAFFSLFLIIPSSVDAAQCSYAEHCDAGSGSGSGQRSCTGSTNAQNVCVFDPDVAPNCGGCSPINPVPTTASQNPNPTSAPTTPNTSPTPASGAGGTVSPPPTCDPNKGFCPVNNTNYGAAQNLDFMGQNFGHLISCVGESRAIDREPCLFNITKLSQTTGLIETTPMLSSSSQGGGAIGMAQTVAMSLFANPPVRTVEYIAYFKENIGIPTAYAQVGGSGSNVLSPVLKLWTITRNLAYLLVVVVFLVVGFMIMFRKKISQNLVVGVQQALPGIIIGLILITFSYLIASLIIDFAFVGSLVIGKIFEAQGLIDTSKTTTEQLLRDSNVIQMFSGFLSLSKPEAFDQTISSVLSTISVGIIGWIVNLLAFLVGCGLGGNLGGTIGGVVGTLSTDAGGAVASGVGSLAGCGIGGLGAVAGKELIISWLVYAILMVALLISMFKLLFKLLSNYISIMVLTIVAPLMFLSGCLPGNQGVFGSWIKSMFANVLSFPAVFLTFLFAAFLLGPGAVPLYGIKEGADFTGSTSTLPLIGGFPVDLVRLLLAYGVLLGSSAVPDMIANMLKVDSKLTQQLVSTASGTYTGAIGTGTGLYNTGYRSLITGGARPNEASRGLIPRASGWLRTARGGITGTPLP